MLDYEKTKKKKKKNVGQLSRSTEHNEVPKYRERAD